MVPRDFVGYSATGVRLAYPDSVTMSKSVPSTGTSIDSSSSSPRNFMPRTPEVERPMGRSCSSVAAKRTACPSRETRMRSWSAMMVWADTSSSGLPASFSRRLMAMMPPERGELYRASGLFLTRPDLVASTRWSASS